jgi:hypothetical protein
MKKSSKKNILMIMTVMSCLLLSGCTLQDYFGKNTQDNESKSDSLFIAATVGSYDSLDTAIIKALDREEKTITLQNMESGKDYTLTYSEATTFKDKYGEALADTQVICGDVVDVSFMKTNKTLTTLQISSTVWAYTDITNFSIAASGESMEIGDTLYKIEDQYVVASNDQIIDLMDINERDILTVYGSEQTIYSIIVQKGHGYVTLTNDSDFIGGFIEIGQAIIKPIKEDMILVVPEGTYDVLITKDGNNGTLPLVIARDEEVELDLGNIEIAETQNGNLTFTLSPENASITFDDKVIDAGTQIAVPYGIHKMVASADGYETSTLYVKVGQPVANVEITLTKDTESDSTDSSDEDSTATDTETTDSSDSTEEDTTGTTGTTDTTGATITDYLVYIEAPAGAEVYLDGNYVGIAPASFDKTSGNHVITLRKTGYQTRSYTIDVDSTQKDSIYSFSDLATIGQ